MNGKIAANVDDPKIARMLLGIVRSLVDHPDQAEIVLISTPEGTTFCIYAHSADVAKLLGSAGQTARALRIIVGASGRKLGRHLTLDIVEGVSRPQ